MPYIVPLEFQEVIDKYMDISIDVHVYIKVEVLYLMHAFDENWCNFISIEIFDIFIKVLYFFVLCIISSVKMKMGANRNEFIWAGTSNLPLLSHFFPLVQVSKKHPKSSAIPTGPLLVVICLVSRIIYFNSSLQCLR